jgi:hypothetical protein
VRVRDLPSWHRFTYTQSYPAVLGAMLYDVLHITEDWGAVQVVGLSIVGLYCVDYFHLQCDLGSDQLPRGNWRDTALDAAIAIAFGVAYWQAADEKLLSCYVVLTVVGLLILVYNLTPDRRSLGVVVPHAILAALFATLAWLTTRIDGVTWTFVSASWLPTVWYAVYVFGVANRTLRPCQPAKAGS